MITMGNLISIFLSLLFISVNAVAAEFFVATSGNDSNTGSSTSPFRTIQKGINVAKPGDIITVRPGTYSPATISTSGTSTAPITLRAQNPAVLNPESSRARIVGSGSGRGLTVNGAYWIVDGFEVTGFGTGIALEPAANRPVVRQTVIHNNSGQGIQCWKCNYSLIEKNHFYDPGAPYPDLGNAMMDYGVNLYVSTGNKIINNYFFGKFNHDISIKYLVKDTYIAHNTFEGCMLQCIELGQTPDDQANGGDKTSQNAIVEYNVFRDAVDSKTGAFYRHHNSININNIVNAVVRYNYFENNTGYPMKTLYSDFLGSQHIGVAPANAKIYGNIIANQRTKDPYSGAGTASYAILIQVRQTSTRDLVEIYNNTVIGTRNFLKQNSGTTVIEKNNLFGDATQLVGPMRVFDPYANRGPRGVLTPNWSVAQAFRLISGSKYIDAGTGVGLPFTGSAPDIGNNEFIPGMSSSPAPDPAPAPAPTPIAGPKITLAPQVSNVTSSSVYIKWGLSEPSTGQIEYGTTTSYGQLSTLETRLFSTHNQRLTGLKPGTTYYFRVISKNKAGGVTKSQNFTFKTRTP